MRSAALKTRRMTKSTPDSGPDRLNTRRLHFIDWLYATPLWSIVAAFGTYFCMYAFRKPFTAATYSGMTAWNLDYKTVLVTAHVFGYAVSKFIGIKVVAEMTPARRAVTILLLNGIAEVALILFGVVPAPYNCVFLFCSALPLGMVFGLVLGFLEGRQQTEALAAGLCASFVVADGATKSVGVALLQSGVPEHWMPCLVGLSFVAPLVLFVWMLTRIPPPTSTDVAHRTERIPLHRAERWNFLSQFAGGLALLGVVYLLITILRSVRADFATEIWTGLGYAGQPGVFTTSELLVGLGVMVINGCNVLVRDNRRAFFAAVGTALGGLALIAVALLGLRSGALGGFAFMVLVGLGLYLPYVAVHTAIFERLIAMTRTRGNVGFLLTVADAVAYLGYVAVMLIRAIGNVSGDILNFFTTSCLGAAGLSAVCLVLCGWYFAARVPAVAEAPA